MVAMRERERPIMRDVFPSEDAIASVLQRRWDALPVKNREAFIEYILSSSKEKVAGEVVEILERTLPNDLKELNDEQKLVKNAARCILQAVKHYYTPDAWMALQRQQFVERGGFTPLTEYISYGTYNDTVHMHVAPSFDQSPLKMASLFKQGMQELARRLREPHMVNIQVVSGISPLIGKNPRLLELLGFSVVPATEEERKMYFPNEKGPIGRATISRDAFLKQFARE